MNMNWDLNNIYTSFESERFKTDRNTLSDYLTNINTWVDDNLIHVNDATNKLHKFLKLNNEYRTIYLRLHCYTYLLVSIDGENAQAMNMLDELENKNDELAKSSTIFTKWLSNIPNIEEIICSDPYILEHEFYLKEIISKTKYMLNENEEQLIRKMQSTGSRAWQRLYMGILSGTITKVKMDGKSKSLSFGELKNMAYEKDSTLRKLASMAEKRACKKVSQTVSSCINEISGEAINIADIKGYDSVLHKVLLELKMDQETLNAMMSALKDYLPVFHKYFEAKGRMLGHKTTIPFCDIYAPIGKGSAKISYADCRNLMISSFRTFSEELSDFAKRVFDENWIDAEPRAGKGNYGLAVDIFPIKESRIMTNFSGNYIDVIVLAHEIGHAYHSYCLREEEMLNTDYSTSIAETASIFCEAIINNELIKRVQPEEKAILLERSISDTAYYVVDMYGRYLFECELYERRKVGILSVPELNKIRMKSMKQAYGDSIDVMSMNPYSWVNNLGFYLAGNEFLNIPYTFGVLFSKGLYAEYRKKGRDFVTDYEKFLKITSKNNIVDIGQFMNIDVHSVDFWNGAMKMIEEDIKEFILKANEGNVKDGV